MGECAGGVYKPRNPRESPLYQLVEDYYDYFDDEDYFSESNTGSDYHFLKVILGRS